MSDEQPVTPGAYAITGKMPRPMEFAPASIPLMEKAKWAFEAVEFSAVGSALYPWDPKIVALLRRFDRDYLPLLVRSTFKNPNGGIVSFERHASAYQTWTPRSTPKVANVLWPVTPGAINYGREARGHIIVEDIWEGILPLGDGLPGAFRPFDGRYTRRWLDAYWQGKADEAMGDMEAYNAIVQGQADVKKRAEASRDAEIDYRWKQDWKKDKELAQKVTASDLKALEAGPRPHEAKPFFHLKGH